MAAQLLFIHGIGGHKDLREQERLWTSALAEGAGLAGHHAVAQQLLDGSGPAVRYVGYRDLFDEPGVQGSTSTAAKDQLVADLLQEVITGQLSEHGELDPAGALTRARAYLEPDGVAQGPGNIAGRIVDAATTLVGFPPLRRAGQWVSGKILVSALAQVPAYLARGTENDIGERIRSRFLSAMGDIPSVVVAHSLGTVVTFEALQDTRVDVPLWVTLGSPLGMRTVVWPRLVPQPPSTPPTVRSWLNFWDRDDLIVARRRLEQDVRPNAAGIRPVSYRSFTTGVWTHTATKYLRQPGVAGPIAAALAAADAERV